METTWPSQSSSRWSPDFILGIDFQFQSSAWPIPDCANVRSYAVWYSSHISTWTCHKRSLGMHLTLSIWRDYVHELRVMQNAELPFSKFSFHTQPICHQRGATEDLSTECINLRWLFFFHFGNDMQSFFRRSTKNWTENLTHCWMQGAPRGMTMMESFLIPDTLKSIFVAWKSDRFCVPLTKWCVQRMKLIGHIVLEKMSDDLWPQYLFGPVAWSSQWYKSTYIKLPEIYTSDFWGMCL